MSRPGLISAFLIVGAMLGAAQSAVAQSPYRPTTPTLSPWFGLYQKNTGPLDPYHYFVRPRMEAAETLQQQDAAIQRQETGLRSMGQELTQLQQEGPIRPTGSASVFMNYSHYYPSKGPGGQTTAAASHASHRSKWTPPPATTSASMSGMSGMSGMSAGRGF